MAPRCLNHFSVSKVIDPSTVETVFDELAVFNIGCTCGSPILEVFGHPDPDAGLLCPLVLTCPACGSAKTVFDVREHGYDAEFDHGCYSMVGEGEPSRHQCICGSGNFHVRVGLSYQIEPIDDLGEDAIGHIQDFFDGFSLDTNCVKCGKNECVASYECA
jgi:hypothetical protein